MNLSTDQHLVSMYIRGDDAAFGEIVQRYYGSLWWVARKNVTCDFDAQDILQEALLRASQGLHRFRADCSLKTWLHRLVVNASYDYRTTRYRLSELSLLDDATAEIPHRTYDPLAALDLTLTLSMILAKLSDQQRTVLVLVDLLGFTIARTAEDLGISTGTAKSRRARAQQYIRARYPELVGM